jgi:tetratricopeptide (TPR) repeat protein
MLRVLRHSAAAAVLLAIILLPQSGRTGIRTLKQDQSIQLFTKDLARLKRTVGSADYRLGEREGKRLLAAVPALSRPDLELSTRRYLGASQLGTGRYRDALETLIPARDLAVRRGDFRNLWSIASNIAWVYLEMNNPEAAGRFADQSLAAERACGEFNVRPIISRAFIYAYTADFPPAERLFSEAIDRSLAAGDVSSAASAWNLLGDSYLKAAEDDDAGRPAAARGRLLARAEIAETEAFRLRKLHHLVDLDQSERDLARALAGRGDLRTAGVLMEEAVAAMGDPHSAAPIWFFLRSRGQLRAMRGDLEGALPDLRAALELARRLDVVPTDDDRITFESGLAELYSLFIDTGNRLYLRNHDPQLKAEVFEAAEESRAASLRALVPQPHDWRTRLPAEHGEVLARLQLAERSMVVDAARGSSAAKDSEDVHTLRAALHDIESRAGAAEETGSQSALDLARRALDGDSAILAYHLGPGGSWVWSITRETFDVSRLAPKPELTAGAARFRAAIRGSAAERICSTCRFRRSCGTAGFSSKIMPFFSLPASSSRACAPCSPEAPPRLPEEGCWASAMRSITPPTAAGFPAGPLADSGPLFTPRAAPCIWRACPAAATKCAPPSPSGETVRPSPERGPRGKTCCG